LKLKLNSNFLIEPSLLLLLLMLKATALMMVAEERMVTRMKLKKIVLRNSVLAGILRHCHKPPVNCVNLVVSITLNNILASLPEHNSFVTYPQFMMALKQVHHTRFPQ